MSCLYKNAVMSQSRALLLSMATEAAVACALIAALRWGSSARAALAAIVGTLATHGLAWWAILELTQRIF